jgi:hypothetical protein
VAVSVLVDARRLVLEARDLAQRAASDRHRSGILLDAAADLHRRSLEIGRPSLLLSGEDVDTGLLEDAQHWAAVYQELLIGLTGLRSVEGGSTHVGLRRSQLRCELRLRYWQAQIQQRCLSEEPVHLLAESASPSGRDHGPRSTMPSTVSAAAAGGRHQG